MTVCSSARGVQSNASAELVFEELDAGFGPLRIATIHPDNADRTVLVLPGRGEFIEKYLPLLGDLADRGHASACVDWRGQGGSGRLLPHAGRGHVESFDHYLDDLDHLLKAIARSALPPPTQIVASSMGGHIALRFLRECPHDISRAALLAPMFDIDYGHVPAPLAALLAATATRLGQANRYAFGQRDPDIACHIYKGNQITSCPEQFANWVDLLKAHPDKHLGGVTFGWLDAAIRSIRRTREPGYLEGIAIPLLILSASDEAIVSNDAHRAFADRLPICDRVIIAGARHDLLREGSALRAQILARIEAFLELGPGRVSAL